MRKIENKGLKMSAVYSNKKYKKIYKAWYNNKKIWHAISRYDGSTEYFDNFYIIIRSDELVTAKRLRASANI